MNAITNTTKAVLVYNGADIRDRGEMLSLTDMWKAAGSDAARQPANWLVSADASRFIGYVTEVLNPRISGNELVKTVRGGKSPGSWAHWQIALAYAKYLSPEFHMWCNEVVRERMEGKAAATAHTLTKYDMQMIGNAIKNCAGLVIRDEIDRLLPLSVDRMIEDRLATDPRVAVLGYVSVNQILDAEFKVPPKGRRSIRQKVFRRLQSHCLANGIKAFKSAHSGTWLFPPHEATAFIRQSCMGLIREHLDRKNGQGKLRLVGGGA